MGETNKKQKYLMKDVLKFSVTSILGLLLFLVPLPYGKMFAIEGLSSINIGIGFISEIIKIYLSDLMSEIILAIMLSSAILSIIAKFIDFKSDFFKNLFDVAPIWLIFRILGAIISIMIYFNSGLEIVTSELTGGTMMGVIPSLVSIFLVSGFLLPLILDFGLMELLGTLISKTMKKLFLVPGRASIDTLTSWLGDGTLGIMLTNTQLKQGYYTKKESAIIAVCFSLVSLPFSTVIADQLGLMDMFVVFYGTVILASLTCAIILPRIYPLNKIPDTTYNDVEHIQEITSCEGNLFKQGLERALTKCQSAPTVKEILVNGFKTVIDMYMGLLPLVLVWGTTALIVAEFTDIFTWISYPIVLILKLLQIPNAVETAPAVLVGFTDMFLPSIIVSGESFPMITKFIIGVLSISQLIFMTETGAVILKSDIPLTIKDLFKIFLIRTAIALPIITLVAHIIF